MIKLTKKEKILSSVFGAFLLLFLLDKGIFSPFLNKSELIDSKIKMNEKKLRKLLYIDSQREEISRTFSAIKPYIEIGKTEEDALAVIMKKIEEMAKDCDITLLNMKPETVEGRLKLAYRTKRVSLNIQGPQNNIVKFLYKLENSHYPLTIKELDFKIKDRDAGLMEADLEMHFIHFL